MDTIEIKGVQYVKALDLAKQLGYTADYVGQLARAGKIEARQVGRAWYVRENDLNEHKREKTRSNKEKTLADVKKTIALEQKHEIHTVFYAPPATEVFGFRKKILDTVVRYETDLEPLSPQMMKLVSQGDNVVPDGVAKTLDVADEDHPTVPPQLLRIQEHTKNAVLVSERSAEPPMKGGVSVVDLNEYKDEKLPATISIQPVNSYKNENGHGLVAVPKVISAGHHLVHRKIEVVSEVPVISLSRRRPLFLLILPLVTSLIPLLFFIACALSVSGLFLQHVLVYQQGETLMAQPYYQAYYDIVKIEVLTSALSR